MKDFANRFIHVLLKTYYQVWTFWFAALVVLVLLIILKGK